jgi:hypothetical protein
VKLVHILVEGSTEEKFVKEILAPHFSQRGVYLTPINLCGVSKYSIVRREVKNLLKNNGVDLVTTMLDYYGLHNDFPGKNSLNMQWDYLQKVGHLEKAFGEDIGDEKFLPYLQMHEFEALLFCDAEPFSRFTKEYMKIQKIADDLGSPEQINDSPSTAPSKRIQELVPTYQKTLHGAILAQDIGLVKMREQCKHFDYWINKLES